MPSMGRPRSRSRERCRGCRARLSDVGEAAPGLCCSCFEWRERQREQRRQRREERRRRQAEERAEEGAEEEEAG